MPACFSLLDSHRFCSLLNPGLIEKDPPRASPTAFFGSVMPMPIPQPKPTDKPREFGAAGACPAGGGVSEPTHSMTPQEKQPRRAGMERAGGGKKTKTETELGGREGCPCFSSPGEARRGGGMLSSESTRPQSTNAPTA